LDWQHGKHELNCQVHKSIGENSEAKM